jgi:iron(III) transport system ATP-binding protein
VIQISNLRKCYWTQGARVQAVDGVDVEVGTGEIFMLLGPSGCGKTTTLRCVAGLEIPDEGEIRLSEQVVFGNGGEIMVPVYQRGVGMVFQSYAIWPHLSVFDNVAYPLVHGRFRIDKSAVKDRVHRVLSLVGLEGMADRPAPLLSGGQQQRVALARALAYEPKVLLLDEPLSNLDAKLRAEMRVELRRLIKTLNLTALYVTHDQEEALVLGDRIAVMAGGKILQVGAPREVYARPRSEVVADFLGAANLLEGAISAPSADDDSVLVQTAMGTLICNRSQAVLADHKVTVMFRPEDLRLRAATASAGENSFLGVVEQALFLGGRVQCQVIVNTLKLRAETANSQVYEPGQGVMVEIPRAAIQVFF